MPDRTGRRGQQAERDKVPIYTVALGTPNGVAANPDPVNAPPIAVPPDPALMAAIAQASGARTFNAQTADQLSSVYKSLGSQLGSVARKREITVYFAVGGLALLLLAAVGLGTPVLPAALISLHPAALIFSSPGGPDLLFSRRPDFPYSKVFGVTSQGDAPRGVPVPGGAPCFQARQLSIRSSLVPSPPEAIDRVTRNGRIVDKVAVCSGGAPPLVPAKWGRPTGWAGDGGGAGDGVLRDSVAWTSGAVLAGTTHLLGPRRSQGQAAGLRKFGDLGAGRADPRHRDPSSAFWRAMIRARIPIMARPARVDEMAFRIKIVVMG